MASRLLDHQHPQRCSKREPKVQLHGEMLSTKALALQSRPFVQTLDKRYPQGYLSFQARHSIVETDPIELLQQARSLTFQWKL